MARGFESKDIEYQQAEAERQQSIGRGPTPEERDASDRRRTLQLSIARAEADLRAATSPTHRHMLEQAIAVLRERLDRDSLDDAS